MSKVEREENYFEDICEDNMDNVRARFTRTQKTNKTDSRIIFSQQTPRTFGGRNINFLAIGLIKW